MDEPTRGKATTAVRPLSGFGPYDRLSEDAHQLYIDGYSDEAVRACRQALAFVELTDDRNTGYFLRYTCAVSLMFLGRYRAAAAEARVLLASLQDSAGPFWRSKAMAVLAEASIADGDVGRGLDSLAEAYALVQIDSSRDYNHMAALMAVALAMSPALLFESADELLRAAMRARADHGPAFKVLVAQEAALLRVTWGTALDLLGSPREARQHYREALSRTMRMRREAQALGDNEMVARSEVLEGYALQRFGMDGLADGLLRQGLAGFPQRVELNETQLALIGLALASVGKGRYDDARVGLRQVLDTPDQPNRYIWQSMALAVMAVVDQAEYGPHPAVDRWREIARQTMLRMWHERANRFTSLRDRITVRRLGEDAARMSRQALEDPLTGLGNRRMLDQVMTVESFARALIFVDIDRFKDVNDLYSHEVGDHVLRRVSDILRTHCRSDDILVRYGGDEFLALVSGHLDAATEVAYRVVDAVGREDWALIASGLQVTVSVGVAGGGSARGLLTTVDTALYAAKRTSGNRVVVA